MRLSFLRPSTSIPIHFHLSWRHLALSGHLRFHHMASITLPKLAILEAISSHDPKSTAVIHSGSGRRFLYGHLLRDVAASKDRLHQSVGGQKLGGHKIAFLVENSYDFVGAIKKNISSSRAVADLNQSRFSQYLVVTASPFRSHQAFRRAK